MYAGDRFWGMAIQKGQSRRRSWSKVAERRLRHIDPHPGMAIKRKQRAVRCFQVSVFMDY